MLKQTTKQLFQEYRQKAEQNLQVYNQLKTKFPYHGFPTLGKAIWRAAMLAEIWGLIASKRNAHGIDYLQSWRDGE